MRRDSHLVTLPRFMSTWYTREINRMLGPSQNAMSINVGKRHERATTHRRKAELTWNNHYFLNGHLIDDRWRRTSSSQSQRAHQCSRKPKRHSGLIYNTSVKHRHHSNKHGPHPHKTLPMALHPSNKLSTNARRRDSSSRRSRKQSRRTRLCRWRHAP